MFLEKSFPAAQKGETAMQVFRIIQRTRRICRPTLVQLMQFIERALVRGGQFFRENSEFLFLVSSQCRRDLHEEVGEIGRNFRRCTRRRVTLKRKQMLQARFGIAQRAVRVVQLSKVVS